MNKTVKLDLRGLTPPNGKYIVGITEYNLKVHDTGEIVIRFRLRVIEGRLEGVYLAMFSGGVDTILQATAMAARYTNLKPNEYLEATVKNHDVTFLRIKQRRESIINRIKKGFSQ